jgi:hypothetical protein
VTPTGGAEARRLEHITVAVVVVVVVVLLYARAPFAPRQFWAEDGREFFADALRMGPIETFGQANAGYYLIVPRIGGVIASLAPIRVAPFVSWAWVAAVVAWCAATIMVTGRTWLHSLSARVGLALALVLLPVLGEESIANAANLQFTMLFAALVVLIGETRGRLELVSGCALVAATGLTTPLSAVLLPFVAYRVWRVRPRWFDPVAVAWLVGVAVQWLAIAIARPERNVASGESFRKILRRFVDSAVTENLSPLDAQTRGVGNLLAVLFVIGVGAAIVVAWRARERDRAALMVAVPAFGFVLLAASGFRFSSANRYMVLPSLCLVWAILAATETLWTGVPSSWRIPRWAAVGVVVAGLLIAWIPHWNASDQRQSGRTWSEELDVAAETCRIRQGGSVAVLIAPQREPGSRQWVVELDCDDVPS